VAGRRGAAARRPGRLAGWPGGPARRPGALAGPARGGREADPGPRGLAGPVFVGRDRELDQLGGLLADATAGRPGVAVVEGEAGLGKSSLITQFLSRHRGLPVLAASGEVSEQALPWGMVRQLVHRADSDLLPGFPLLGGGPAAADPLAVGEELAALFADRSARGGLVVALEDLQWADLPSARALLFACRRLAGGRVLVLVSARPQQLGRLGDGWARFLTGDRRCSRLALGPLALGPLGAAELAQLAAGLGLDLSDRAVRRVAARLRPAR
jgi:hypothetical protein